MIPAINIIQSDIGKTARVLVKGQYLYGEVIGKHGKHYVAFVTDTGRYERVTFKHLLYIDDELKNKIIDILKVDSCTVYPPEIIADYLYDGHRIDMDYETIEDVLAGMASDDKSNVQYHIPSGGYLYVDNGE